jgi:hypothetical protein
VKLLKNLSHLNIVVSGCLNLLPFGGCSCRCLICSVCSEKRYLGTVREEDTLNILLEFVPGGSIQSLLGKLGSFPEPVSNHQSVVFTVPLSSPVKELKHNIS